MAANNSKFLETDRLGVDRGKVSQSGFEHWRSRRRTCGGCRRSARSTRLHTCGHQWYRLHRVAGVGRHRTRRHGGDHGSSTCLALSAQEFHAPGVFGSFPDALIPGLNLVEGGQVSTGSILNWFKRNFGQGVEAEAAAQGVSAHPIARPKRQPKFRRVREGLIVLDYFQGNRTPHTDSAARAPFGFSSQSSRAQVFRALMEGIAYGMRDILETFAKHNFTVARIIASGAAMCSPLFMQIYADVLGMPIYTTKFPEATMLGSAVIAASWCWRLSRSGASLAWMVTVAGEYRPDQQRHADYAFFMRKYQETYPQLKALMQAMNQKVSG